MAKSLKEQNRPLLVTVLLVNLSMFGALLLTNSFVFPNLESLQEQWKSLVPASLALIVCGVLNEQFSPNAKARLVFWRWGNPLPGSEAFSKHGPADPRIDMAAIAKKGGGLPTSPTDQNLAWYRLYKKVADKRSVADAHKAFLFNRDYAGLSLLFIVGLSPVVLWRVHPWESAAGYIAILVAQYLLVRRAAANSGRRLVTNVLATIF